VEKRTVGFMTLLSVLMLFFTTVISFRTTSSCSASPGTLIYKPDGSIVYIGIDELGSVEIPTDSFLATAKSRVHHVAKNQEGDSVKKEQDSNSQGGDTETMETETVETDVLPISYFDDGAGDDFLLEDSTKSMRHLIAKTSHEQRYLFKENIMTLY